MAQIGTYDVVVKTWGGVTKVATNPPANNADLADNYTYRYPMPAIPTLTPADGAIVNAGATSVTVVSAGATCTYGISASSTNSASGANYTVVVGGNTLYYSCVAGSGDTQSQARTGSWSFTGRAILQTITTSSCPTTRTMAMDARDDHTYWIQKLGDGKCWMLTNLAYAGVGNNAYGDTKNISLGAATSYTAAYYYVMSSSQSGFSQSYSTSPTAPLTNTNGAGQYGYLYNWCAAMGAQANACNNSSTSGFTSTSICPRGWRLPTANGGEFAALVSATGGNVAGLLSNWLGVYSGVYDGEFSSQGSYGDYWSSTPDAGGGVWAYHLVVTSGGSPGTTSSVVKQRGLAVRCVTN
jgi:hypothetical protein